ncbi:MAG: hypothetical protein AYK22_03940 [Thermoplasmatales archaeon SG8-52-3]|nr:MAG: hypothetical protein AYK22_03940 [Thermoplasmatales archaeon SG8-52-3]
MIKFDRRVILFISIAIVICASFQPIIAAINIESIDTDKSPVNENSAYIVASAKLEHLKKTNYKIITSNQILDNEGSILGYVFNLNPQGYIVIPAYKILPPVLAYSFSSSFSKEGLLLYDLIKEDISRRITYSSEIKEKTIEENKALWNSYLNRDSLVLEKTFSQWPKEGATSTDGWLETQWHQNSPYNNFCPIDLVNNKRSVAGCPSIAIAQILNYHRTTNNVQFNDSDDYYHNWGNYYWIDDDYETYDFPSFPQLNTYLDTLVMHYQNEEALTDDDMAALTFACGVAARQVYSSTISGTFGVSQAYDAYQRLYFYDCELLTDDEPYVYERIQENIMNGLPVHLAVVNEAWNSGHNLVIDGYNDDGYYHLNFGWGGSYDGWYKIPEELPYELTVLEGVIVDIIDENTDSNLHSEGALYWPGTNPGATVEGSFTIENVGAPGSSIDWEITVWPDWGEWSFDPISSEGLTPESGPLTIDVSVISPDKNGKHFNGYVKVVDVDNIANSCLVHVSLSTPRSRELFTLIDFLFERNPNIISFLRFLFHS